jgi:hypothetical protein
MSVSRPVQSFRWSVLPLILSALVLSLSFVGGCGQKPASVEPGSEEQHILQFLNLWSYFRNAHQGQPPKSIKEMETWVKSLSKEQREKIKIDNLEGAFVSPRDGQPYELGPPPPQQMKGMARVIVYEKTGVSGKHLVAGGGSVGRMSDEELRKWIH